MILNLKILPFIELENVEERFEMIYEDFEKEGNNFREFLDYFEGNWIKSSICEKDIWNYSRGVINIILFIFGKNIIYY